MELGRTIILDIGFPALPPTINQLYATVSGRRVKSSEGRAFSNLVALEIRMQQPGFIIPTDWPLEFYLVCYHPTYKRLKLNDSDGRLKAAKDSVFEASFIDPKTGKKTKDSIVQADHAFKSISFSPDKYPQGHCRVIISQVGIADRIMRKLGVL
jgi:Holliday junction resolvase RusA-like endonuclease